MAGEDHRTLADLQAEHIRTILEHACGNRALAARILGISRVGLLAKLKRLGIEAESPARGAHAHPHAP